MNNESVHYSMQRWIVSRQFSQVKVKLHQENFTQVDVKRTGSDK